MMLPRGASHPADYDAKPATFTPTSARRPSASVDALYRLIAEAGIRPPRHHDRTGVRKRDHHGVRDGRLDQHVSASCSRSRARPSVPITIERIQQIGERVPLLANLQPHGPFAMGSLHAIGGVPCGDEGIAGRNGLLHGDVMTVTGKTLAENLARHSNAGADAAARYRFARSSKPIAPANNHISVLEGQHRPGELPAQAVGQDARRRANSAAPRASSNPKPKR